MFIQQPFGLSVSPALMCFFLAEGLYLPFSHVRHPPTPPPPFLLCMRGFGGVRLCSWHVSQELVSLVPNTDQPAVPEDGDGAEHRAGGGARAAQVSPPPEHLISEGSGTYSHLSRPKMQPYICIYCVYATVILRVLR